MEEGNHDPRPRWLREQDTARDIQIELLIAAVDELKVKAHQREGVYLTGRAVAVIITTLAAALVIITAITRLFV